MSDIQSVFSSWVCGVVGHPEFTQSRGCDITGSQGVYPVVVLNFLHKPVFLGLSNRLHPILLVLGKGHGSPVVAISISPGGYSHNIH